MKGYFFKRLLNFFCLQKEDLWNENKTLKLKQKKRNNLIAMLHGTRAAQPHATSPACTWPAPCHSPGPQGPDEFDISALGQSISNVHDQVKQLILFEAPGSVKEVFFLIFFLPEQRRTRSP